MEIEMILYCKNKSFRTTTYWLLYFKNNLINYYIFCDGDIILESSKFICLKNSFVISGYLGINAPRILIKKCGHRQCLEPRL